MSGFGRFQGSTGDPGSAGNVALRSILQPHESCWIPGIPHERFWAQNDSWGLLRGSRYPGFNPQLPNDSRVIRQVGFLSGISGIWGDPRWPRVALCNPMSSVGF